MNKSSLPLTVMLISPHPDDECINGALALRLKEENHAHLINVAVTLGSNKARQKARQKELKGACEVLEMEWDLLSEDWKKKEKELGMLLLKYRPQIILAPHPKDHHPTHIKTSQLAAKAIKASGLTAIVAWCEFWGPLTEPNCLLEVPSSILEMQMEALMKHEGEIARNPYHLRLPAWMMDNVRRGAEVVSNMGEMAPDFAFGVLLDLQLAKGKKLKPIQLFTPYLSHLADVGQIFNEILAAAAGSKTKVKRG